MYKKENTQKGITLIALVITIIVMLILVGVTISMAVNGGLLSKAGDAAKQTNDALKSEQALSNGAIQVGKDKFNSIGEYLDELKKEDDNEEDNIVGEELLLENHFFIYVDGKSFNYPQYGGMWGQVISEGGVNSYFHFDNVVGETPPTVMFNGKTLYYKETADSELTEVSILTSPSSGDHFYTQQ